MAFSLTSLIFLGTAQLALLLLVSTVFLVLYCRKLERRRQELSTRLKASEQEHASKIQALRNQFKEQGQVPEAHSPNSEPEPTLEIPGGEASTLLNRWIDQCEERLTALGAELSTQFQVDDSAEIMAARLRIAFLEGEKLVLPLSNDKDMLWETLQPNIDRVAMSIRRHASALSGSKPMARAETASPETTNLSAAREIAHQTMLELDKTYESLQGLLEQHSVDSQAHALTDRLANGTIALANAIIQNNTPPKQFTNAPVLSERAFPDSQAATVHPAAPDELDLAVEDILARSEEIDDVSTGGVQQVDQATDDTLDDQDIDTDELIAQALADLGPSMRGQTNPVDIVDYTDDDDEITHLQFSQAPEADSDEMMGGLTFDDLLEDNGVDLLSDLSTDQQKEKKTGS